jgi:hypothetical protein
VQLTPAYERDGVRLYAGDCLAVLPTLEAGSVDAIVTDPPYGIRVGDRSDGGVASVKSGSKSYGRTEWDRAPAPPEFFELALSYQVPTVIWGGNYFALPPSPSWLVWDKGQRNFSFADAELAWTNLGKAVRIFDCPRGRLVAEGHKWHPTQKPLSLMIWCMSFLPKECTGDWKGRVRPCSINSPRSLTRARHRRDSRRVVRRRRRASRVVRGGAGRGAGGVPDGRECGG